MLLLKDYGVPAAGLYSIISVTDLAFLTGAAYYGVDMKVWLEHVGVTIEDTPTNALAPLLLAYTIHKLSMPLRIAATAALTPTASRLLRKYPAWVLMEQRILDRFRGFGK